MSGDPFLLVREIGLRLPGVTAGEKRDGSPLLKRDGRFMAGLAVHSSAAPGTLVVRAKPADRDVLIAEAPGVYYITAHYRPHGVVLVRLSLVTREMLVDLLASSWRLSAPKQPSATIRYKW